MEGESEDGEEVLDRAAGTLARLEVRVVLLASLLLNRGPWTRRTQVGKYLYPSLIAQVDFFVPKL